MLRGEGGGMKDEGMGSRGCPIRSRAMHACPTCHHMPCRVLHDLHCIRLLDSAPHWSEIDMRPPLARLPGSPHAISCMPPPIPSPALHPPIIPLPGSAAVAILHREYLILFGGCHSDSERNQFGDGGNTVYLFIHSFIYLVIYLFMGVA